MVVAGGGVVELASSALETNKGDLRSVKFRPHALINRSSRNAGERALIVLANLYARATLWLSSARVGNMSCKVLAISFDFMGDI